MKFNMLIIILLMQMSVVYASSSSSSSSSNSSSKSPEASLKSAASSSKTTQEEIIKLGDLVLYSQPQLTAAQQNLNIFLLSEASNKDSLEKVRAYIKQRADVNHFHADGNGVLITPLWSAIYHGCIDIAKELLLHKPALHTVCGTRIYDLASDAKDEYLKKQGFDEKFIADFRAYAKSDAGKNKAIGFDRSSLIIYKTKYGESE